MLIRRLPVVLLCLLKGYETAVPSLFDLDASVQKVAPKALESSISSLDGRLSRMTLESGSMEPSKPSLSPFEISEQISKLTVAISALDTKAAVKMIEKKLGQIIDSGVALHDIAPTIGSLPLDAKELVLTAMESKAYILLKLLQKAYIWRDEKQHHWFKASSYKSPWYDKDLWEDSEPFPLAWERNLWAVCEWDNGALAVAIQRNIPPGSALKKFDEELLSLCIEYDAIDVFKAIKIDPVRLKEHFEFLNRQSRIYLLKFYQVRTGVKHLHLENFPLPERLPTKVDDFKFLMKNGYNCFPMDVLISRLCTEGKLDLLIYLHATDPKLVPDLTDLEYAAKGGWMDIVKWAYQLDIITKDSFTLFCIIAMAFGHFQAFDLWLGKREIHEGDIAEIYHAMMGISVDEKVLDTLKYIDTRYPIKNGWQEWASLAAKKCFLSTLIWLYEKYKILPIVKHLKHAKTDMLNWIQSTDDTLINVELIKHGSANFELLEWVFENAPHLIPAIREHASIGQVCSMETMIWFNKNLAICSFNMNWAYKIGSLEAIQWAKENCGIYPTVENSCSAAAGGHLHILDWMHKTADTEHPLCFNIETLRAAIRYGNLEVADYLMKYPFPKRRTFINIDDSVAEDRYLITLKWAFEHKFKLNPPNKILQAVERGDFEAVKWLIKTFPAFRLDSIFWEMAMFNKHPKIYRQLLEEYPSWRGKFNVYLDIKYAFEVGNLELVQAILDWSPLIAMTLFTSKMTKCNYHVKQWLIENSMWHF